MNPTREQFISALKKKPFYLRECSICGYGLSFYSEYGRIFYDNGCDFVGVYRSTVIEDVALDFYLNPLNGHHERIKQFVMDSEAISIAAKEFSHE